MPELKLVLGPSGSGKTEKVFQDMIRDSIEMPERNFIVVVPEQFSHATTKFIIERHPRKGIMNIDVLSFARFAHRIFDSAGGDMAEILDDTGKNLILRQVASEHLEELTVLKGCIRRQGIISEVKSIISELIQYEVDPVETEEVCQGEAKRYLSSKLHDIGVLYRAFREKMGSDYITKEELLERAERVCQEAPFLRGACVIFDNFTGFTPIQYRFIRSLFNITDSIRVTLPYDGRNGDFFALSIETIAHLRSLASEAGWEVKTDHLYDNPVRRYAQREDLDFLENNIFRQKGKRWEGDSSHIRLCSLKNPTEEVGFVCEEIVRLVREEGYRYKDIGIVMSDVGRYGRILKEEADRLQIPCFVDETNRVYMNPLVEFIRSALEIIIDNFSYESVFHFLRTGLMDLSPEDIDVFENYVRALRIRGRKKYRDRFSLHVKGMKEEDLEHINSLRERILEAFGPLDKLTPSKKLTARKYVEALRDFLANLQVDEKIATLSDRFLLQGEDRLSDEYGQILEKVDGLFTRIENLIPGEKMALREFLDTLNAGFDEMRIGTIPPGADSVTAGDMTRSRFSAIRALFFLGLNESLIPKENAGSGLLSDLDREFLKARNVNLSPTAREKIGEEKLYFYLSITKPKDLLCCTFSRNDREGKVIRISYFVSVLRGLFPKLAIETIQEGEYRSDLRTDRDALISLSRSLACKQAPEDGDKELFRFFSASADYRDQVRMMTEAAFRHYRSDPISKAVAKELYGSGTIASPTRLERFASCAYEHYLRYGLRLMEREEFGFERRDLGNVLHGVLNLCGEILAARGQTFEDLDDEEVGKLTEQVLDRFLRENENVVLLSSQRNRYFVNRISRILKTTVKVLGEQEKSGDFRAEAFEKQFRSEGFIGRIDRIDTAEKGNVIYLSVIDYKSGDKDFDLTRLYYGLDLQLAVYLNGAMEIERVAHPSMEVKPAGIFYYHIDDPVINAADLTEGTDSEIHKKVKGKLKLRGLVNSDPEVLSLFDREMDQKSDIIPVAFKKDGSFYSTSSVASEEDFAAILATVRRRAADFRARISEGEIDPVPVLYDKRLSCDYCDFRDCCSFDPRVPGYLVRRLKKIEDPGVFSEEEEGSGGFGVDP
ncbi:MAG: PD-(D/E)XK nuclease family protein [Lachnospiraceae bacterium]|nr:PD-(D/E)XK nuclease family protein [Lachnospiraceae bacterium]